jgi:small-conductance mechanosensitive channel
LPRALTASAFLLALALSGGATAAADDGAAARPDAAAAKAARGSERRDDATVAYFNRPIATLRAPFLGIAPAGRAEGARSRIGALLERGGPGLVTVETLAQGAVLKIDGALAFVLANEDVDLLAGDTLDAAAQDAKAALEKVIAETHEARSTRLMVAAGLWAGGATVVYLCLLWLLRKLARTVSRRMLRLTAEAAGHLRVGGTEILPRDRAIRIVRRMLQAVFWAAVLLLTYEWVGYVLGRFPYTRPWGEHLNAFLADTVANVLVAVATAIPELLIAVAIFLVARAATGVLAGFFNGVQTGRVQVDWLDPDSARPTRRLAAFAVWVFAVVMAYPYIPGSGTEAFKGLSVLLGLMLSIGASGIVGQAASGLILMYTRTFRPGEYVRVGEHEGTIVEMGMFTTRLRTGLGEELTLPNSLTLASATKNYSRAVKGKGFVVDTAVTIGYDAPWRQVHAMLAEAARRTEGVLADPAPHVFQTALSDFYVEYRLVCQAVQSEPRPRAEVLSSLHGNVQDVFNEHGVQIMSPHYLGDPAEPKVVPKAKWHEAPAEPEAGPPR